ncbi:HAD family hydrolase [Kribbella sp. CA-253562]|uniref:HAD family hydrolase n=1 Tax=Kribbella sp. CA-253562 TaxID=3239942 RepID=UPI003D92CED6
MIKAILYDLDGTLIDSETAGLVSWTEVFRAHGCSLDEQLWLAEIAAGRGPCMPTAELEAAVGHRLDWADLEKQRLVRRDELLVARPGALEHLAQARTMGLATALVTNAPQWWVAQQLCRNGLDEHNFDTIVTGHSGLPRKPAPEIYLKALDLLKVNPAEAVSVEDSPVGISSAVAADVTCVAVANQVTRQLDLSGADLVVDSLTEVMPRALLARFSMLRERQIRGSDGN